MAKATVKQGWRWGNLAAAGAGVGLAGLGLFLVLSFVTGSVSVDPAEAAKSCWTGLLGAWLAFGGINTFGFAPAIVLGILIFCWGVHTARTMRLFATWPQIVGGLLAVAATSLGACALAGRCDMASGGLLAVYVSPPALLYFGRWGLVLAAFGVMFLGVLLAFGETAVLGAHQFLFSLRNLGIGLLGVAARLRELLRMLASPRLAVAGGTTGEGAAIRERLRRETRTVAKDGAEPASSAGETAEEGEDDEEPKNKTPIRDWKPRGEFKSRFLALDLRGDEPESEPEPWPEEEETVAFEPAAEAVEAAIADDPGATDAEEEAFAADIIMDVAAEAEDLEKNPEEDSEEAEEVEAEMRREPVFASVAEPVASAPRPGAAERPRLRPDVERPGAYGGAPANEKPIGSISDMSEYRLPDLELLDPPEPPVIEDRGQIEARARILEQTLGEFKIEGRVVHIERGPRVTMYELCLAPGIRLSKVTSLADNLAMQLQAESVRIIAPIPGKNTIGIEIPNTTKELVSLREIVDSVSREKRKQALPICLGKDVSGQALVADLARMPHLLIAGATGSGKSVCINSIIMSVMMCCRPDEAQLIMVDPKVVELSRFKDIPHLMSPVITDMKRAVSVLDWICQKMDERYEQMSQVAVNNIAKFNAIGEEGIRERLDAFASLEEMEAFPKKMPYMVVIIDELADLMMVAGKEVEHHITRLAAKSRAVGIHLILATQRPSVDVITGLIKANMPCRIAFQVASRVDSRTILDGNGAETLLGQGDMLYLPPGVGKLTRAQGVFVSDEELFRVVNFTKAEAEPQYHADLLGPVIGGGAGAVDVSSFDELFLQSGEAIIENQRGSVSLLQRKFGIGYGRAARIIDQLASVGLLGPFRDGKAREILLTIEEFRAKFGGGSSDCDDYDDGAGGLAGLRDDERERDMPDWDEEEAV